MAAEKRPHCAAFLGQVLQALFSRPGYYMSLAEAPNTGNDTWRREI